MTAPQRRRAVAAVAVWLLAVGVAGVLSWRAIDSAGRQVVAPLPVAQPSADTPAPVATSPSPTAQAPTAPTPSAAPARTVSTRGGTAAASCTDGATKVTYATPADGWRVEVEPEDGGDVRVDFRSDADRVRIRFLCAGGQVHAVTEEDTGGSEPDAAG